ncbi:hypothetical protein TTHERM_00531970 (macronuclear) [Tetrahymena thermophila SB210]|uniref:Uncharacterized protein n=1 Tax=Tetrahymena thermophila (strain SB210) TaxID=312017 RepID=Q248H0_TETTS|nr:hypothetical protein TTHERM_00531970 [Tetrahymena thermophila SB210]EAS04075.2 hypothetical protein TTHERM_00531970 [Tetrahymena thermophila SB210]|eukprot:XP_001024320.2 hypothetical protein TTHERM_00531970 [Tetrahymena thermophila SB210]
MINFQNSYLMHPQNLASYNGQMAMMMVPSNSFYPPTQSFPILNNPASSNVPFVMMAAPQNQMPFYFHQQFSQQDFIQQQKQQQQQQSQIIQQSFYEQQKLHQNPNLQLNFFPLSSAHPYNAAQNPSLLVANKSKQQLQQSFKKNDNHHQIQHFQQYDQQSGQILDNNECQAEIRDIQSSQGKVKTQQDNSFSENLNFIDQDQLKNSKKRTSVTSSVSTASSCSNNLNESTLITTKYQSQNSFTINQLNQDEEGRKKYLNQFEPHIQTYLQQLHEQSYSYSFLEQSKISISNKGNSCHQKQLAGQCFEGEEELQNLVSKNAYLKWAISFNRCSHFAKESLSSLISNNQKYSNVFKLKKKIRKQQLANNKFSIHTVLQTKNNIQNSQTENQEQNFQGEAATKLADHQQNSYIKVAQKAEYNEGQLNEASLSLNLHSYVDDSFDEKFSDKEENSQNKKIQINKETEYCDQFKNQQSNLKNSTLSKAETLPITCRCNSISKGNDTQLTLLADCIKCASQQSKLSEKMDLDQSAHSILKTEAMETEQDFIQMEEENEAQNSKNSIQADNKKQAYKEEEDENSPKSSQLTSSKKVINSKFHNMNKLFMYKLLSSFYLENLEKLNVPFNIREILKKLISLVKLSSKQQSQFQSKQKTDFFSHDHYNLLFLTLNSQTIQYMRENSNNKMLHLSCFKFDLNDVKLPLEHSQNTPQILEKIEYINIVKKYACEIVLQSDLGEEIDDIKGQQTNQQAIMTKQIYTKRALQGIKVLNQGMIVRRF